MTQHTEALQRIESYFDEFCEGVKSCLNAESFDRGDLLDAYGRLARLRERFMRERKNLGPPALSALSKVFENDKFIKGMMDIRQVAEHVSKRADELVIWTTANEPITLKSVESSAMVMFSAPRVTLTKITGSPYVLDHLRYLREAEKRITNAMSKMGQ